MSDTDRADANSLISGPRLARRYGVSPMTVWRWQQDPDLGFPQPLKIMRRNYWHAAEIEQWERARARASRSAA